MHILIVTDQHIDSLGGAQVSIRLQCKYLERAGHMVSIAAARKLDESIEHLRETDLSNVTVLNTETRSPRYGADIDLPATPITKQREYGATWPGKRARNAISQGLAGLPPVDLVHVQGDFWGAIVGYRAARDLGVPVVHTLHNNLDVGTRAVTKMADIAFWGLEAARLWALGPAQNSLSWREGGGAWRYLADLAAEAQAVIAPSSHFADVLKREGVAAEVEVIPTGVDDDLVDELLAQDRAEHSIPQLVWLGRMSPEKRVSELIRAFAQVQQDANLVVVGGGLQFEEMQRLASDLGIRSRVRFTGPVPYRAALTEIYEADLLVQTSIGFETQGMTPYEAAVLGTPTIYCDPDINAEVDVAPSWLVPEGDEATTVSKLASTLETAITEVALSPMPLRVPTLFADEMRQSRRTAQMIEVYEAITGDTQPVD